MNTSCNAHMFCGHCFDCRALCGQHASAQQLVMNSEQVTCPECTRRLANLVDHTLAEQDELVSLARASGSSLDHMADIFCGMTRHLGESDVDFRTRVRRVYFGEP